MADCKCNMREKLVGDGCDICNPALALSYANETIAELTEQRDELLAALKKCAAVCAGETMNKNGLIDALESARAAIAKVEE